MLGRRSAATTVYAAATATVVLLAVAANSQPTREAQLNDGGIWVVKSADGSVGRYLYDIGQLDAQIGLVEATEVDVLQDGDTVLAWNRSSAQLSGVDTSLRELVPGPATVPGDAQVALAGGSLAVLHEGELRAARLPEGTADATGVGVDAEPVLADLDPAATLAVGQDGSVAVAEPGRVLLLRPTASGFDAVQDRTVDGDGPVQVAFVGSTPVALDAGAGRVLLPLGGGSVTLPGTAGTDAVLQQSGPSASTVAVSGAEGLLLVGLEDGGDVAAVSEQGDDRPARPVRVGRCVFGAWASGLYAKSCGGAAAPDNAGFDATPGRPEFRVNRGLVLLNDAATGEVLRADDTLTPPDPLLWQQLDQEQDEAVQQVSQPLEHLNGSNEPPTPEPDELAARPGRTTELHVLDNDTDPESDLLVVESVTAPTTPGASTRVSPDGRSVLLELDDTATGQVQVQYTVTDGYDGSATTTLTAAVAQPQDNKPPALREPLPTGLAVVAGATLRVPVLDDARDKEGDPLLLVDPAPSLDGAAANDVGDGSLLVTAPLEPGQLTVAVGLSDGRSDPVALNLPLQVLDPADPRQQSAPVARPDTARGVVGRPVVVRPLENDLPGADSADPGAVLRLAAQITPVPGVEVVTDQERGTVTVTASSSDSYELTYVAGFGAAPTASEQIRIDIAAADAVAGPPALTPDTAVIRGQSPAVVDVLANDVDPGGGLLVVQDVTPDVQSGLQATVVDGRFVRVTSGSAPGPGASATGTLTYRVSNGVEGVAPVEESVAVTVLPAKEANSAPVAQDDRVVVRAGDVAAVDVVDNDVDPDGDPLVLTSDEAVVVPEVPGVEVSASGRTVRLAAPADLAEPTQVSVDYVVTDPLGARTTGTLYVNVVPDRPVEEDRPPTPRDVEGRLAAGDVYTVPVPVYGVDPDGDPVTVTGVVRPPLLGRVIGVTPDGIVFQSYPDSGGTDTLVYEVVDRFGLKGQASVRLGIAPPGSLAAPVALADQLIAAPGTTAAVDVAANDLVPATSDPVVVPLDEVGDPPPGASLVDGTSVVRVEVPDQGAEPLVVTYGLDAGSGEPATATLTVTGVDGVELPPVALDDAPPAEEADADTVTVDVLANDSDPDGDPAALRLDVLGRDDATVAGREITARVEQAPRQVAYLLTDEQGRTAVGALRVPGRGDGSPRLRPGARIALDGAGAGRTIDLTDLVESPEGKALRLGDLSLLFASPVKGLQLEAPTDASVTVTALGDYTGPGAVSFQVTDGVDLQDPAGRVVQVTVPVQVGPPAPVLRCPEAPTPVVQGGIDVTADVRIVCRVWEDMTVQDRPAVVVRADDAAAAGVTADVVDQTRLVLSARSGAAPGATGAVVLSVEGSSRTEELPVVVIAAPPAVTRAVSLDGLQTERPRTVDLAASISSPLAAPDVAVLSVERVSGGPTTTTTSGTQLTLTPQRGTFGTVIHRVRLTDEASQPDRAVTLTVTSQVQAAPSTPTRVGLVGTGNSEATISWASSSPNGAPVLRYLVTGGPEEWPCPASPCRVTGLSNGTDYQLRVVAVNVVGRSEPSAPVSARPNAIPGDVRGVSLTEADGSIDVSWSDPGGGGSPVTDYLVTLTGPTSEVRSVGTATQARFVGLTNGQEYSFSVRAVNALGPSQNGSVPVQGVPFGAPKPVSPAPSLALKAQPSRPGATGFTASWTWSLLQDNGRPADFLVELVSRDGGRPPAAQIVAGVSGKTSYTVTYEDADGVTNDGSTYAVRITPQNVRGKGTAAESEPVRAAGAPATMSQASASDHRPGQPQGYGNNVIKVSFDRPSFLGSGALESYEYTYDGERADAAWRPVFGADMSAARNTDVELQSLQGVEVQVSLRACNDAGLCSAASKPSNVASAYFDPDAPEITSMQVVDGEKLRVTWQMPDDGGRPVTSYEVCWSQRDCRPANGGMSDVEYYGYDSGERTVTVQAFQAVEEGVNASPVSSRASGRTDPKPQPPPAGRAGTVNGCNAYGGNCNNNPVFDSVPQTQAQYDQGFGGARKVANGTTLQAFCYTTGKFVQNYANSDPGGQSRYGSDVWYQVEFNGRGYIPDTYFVRDASGYSLPRC